MAKILVTGGAGFIGSYLCSSLVGKGHYVICIDNLLTGVSRNIEHLKSKENFEFRKESILHADLNEHFDEIYHLASPASPVDYRRNSLETIYVNTVGTERLLQAAYRCNAKFLYTSTSEAYGNPLIKCQHEEYIGSVNTWGPRACYDEGKRLGETFCYEYLNKYDIDLRVVRIFNTYSARLRENDGRVISNFLNQALNGSNITVYGDGEQTRSFCYVDDTVSGLLHVMQSEKARGQIINLGNPENISILALAHLVIKLTGSKSKIVYEALPVDDPVQRCPDITKAKRLTGWEPLISLEDGIQLAIEEIREKKQTMQIIHNEVE